MSTAAEDAKRCTLNFSSLSLCIAVGVIVTQKRKTEKS
jgi:hypothetical protein